MLMMLRDIIKTLSFALIPSFVFGFLIMQALPNIKNNGIKKVIKSFIKELKSDKRKIYLLCFLMYVFIVFYKTLLQRDFSYNPLSDVFGGWKIFMTQYSGLDYQVIGNVIMFIPLTLFFTLYKSSEKAGIILKQGVTISFLSSLFIEICQLIFSKGTFQFSDIFYNTVGGLIGAIIYLIIKLIHTKKGTE